MGRWRKRALEVVSLALYWMAVSSMHRARGPLMHFSYFLKHVLRPDAAISETKIVQLVCFRAQQVMDELFQVISEPLPGECLASLPDTDPDLDHPGLICWLVFRVVCKHACQFNRRVVMPTRRYPQRMFMLVAYDAEAVSKERQEVASEMLSGDSSNLDPATRKIQSHELFKLDLQHASHTGTMSKSSGGLYHFLSVVAQLVKIDVRDNERINKLLSLLGSSCPNSTLVP